MGTIRLACRFCDRNDFDCVEALPLDWFSVDEVQDYEASIREVEPADPESVLDWYTHLGVCPDCYEVEIRPVRSS